METNIDFGGIGKMYSALENLRTELSLDGKECPIQKATIFLTIILNEGITQQGIKEVQGFHQSTISRNIKELGQIKVKDGSGNWVNQGCNLVVTQPSEYNRREHSVFLTARGINVAKNIANIFN
jgi:DNA-binding MarR family transcriptional regulator